jgi:nitrate/nitrite transporter NarK
MLLYPAYPGRVSSTPIPRETDHSPAAPRRPAAHVSRRRDTGPGDRLVRIGAIIFFIGAVATLATVTPLFIGTDPLPSAAYFVCMLMAVGFVVAAAGVVRSVMAQRRQADETARSDA